MSGFGWDFREGWRGQDLVQRLGEEKCPRTEKISSLVVQRCRVASSVEPNILKCNEYSLRVRVPGVIIMYKLIEYVEYRYMLTFCIIIKKKHQ